MKVEQFRGLQGKHYHVEGGEGFVSFKSCFRTKKVEKAESNIRKGGGLGTTGLGISHFYEVLL